MASNRKPLEDILHNTRISERQLEIVLKKLEIIRFATPNGEEISNDDYYKILYHKDIKNWSKIAAFYGVRRRRKDDSNGSAKNFETECMKLIEKYEDIILDLTGLHFKNLKRLDLFVEESPIIAAYTLIAKSLNLLNMICLNLKHGYLNCIMLFRPLDEAVLLAEYFVLSKDSTTGKKDLSKWFRENKSPSVKILRERFKQFSKQNLSNQLYQIFEGLLHQLHDKQSKSIHNTFADLQSIFEIDLVQGDMRVINFEYKGSSNFRNRLEMTLFSIFKIQNVVQGMICCFEIAERFFSPEDVKALNQINKHLTNRIEEARTRLQCLLYE